MRASKAVDEIGVVIHGPEVIDSGSALSVLDLLESMGRITAVLGGTMGRVAVIDAGLEGRIDISRREIPSRSVRRLQERSDVVILLNQAKTRETGLVFGEIVKTRAEPTRPLLLIDLGGRFVAYLTGDADDIATILARELDLELVDPPPPLQRIVRQGQIVRRRLAGAKPGENISLNGTVIARAQESDVEIIALAGKIVDIRGAVPKPHGLEKLSFVDLERAVLRSGDIRRTECAPRILHRSGHEVVMIDHAAEGTFEAARDAGVVITVGDDTTTIAGDVLARLGVPQIGIVDGDPDRLSHRTTAPKGSTIIVVRSGCDDAVGRRVRAEIFGDATRIALDGACLEDLAKKVKDVAGDDFIRMVRC
ncbi:MAG: DUF2117 domain-containing protein [Euryarchaeota archaeon]|nr:DUF2117 domain-containing protein [Euryarchaeota archaeon]